MLVFVCSGYGALTLEFCSNKMVASVIVATSALIGVLVGNTYSRWVMSSYSVRLGRYTISYSVAQDGSTKEWRVGWPVHVQ